MLAHVPDLNDFVGGLPILLQPGGTITVEVPHLLQLIEITSGRVAALSAALTGEPQGDES